MYNLNDTIVAVSSPSSGARSIVRIAGPATIDICELIFRPATSSIAARLIAGHVTVNNDLEVDALLYLFFAPHSYTGDDVAEIHLYAGDPVTEVLVDNLLRLKTQDSRLKLPINNNQLPITTHQIRMAGPGEFTARAYLNGKLDLAQAEAVNEIVVSSNTLQLAAAEKLLSGRLGQATEKVRSAMIDCLSLIEAGLDFSEETIEFISRQETVERLTHIKGQLEQLLSAGLSYESVIDLPAVGIAGAANAGKSSLLNKLLGTERSIVSEQSKTTRDVLSGLLTLTYCKCVLFDCAGLLTDAESVLDQLAQQAAIEALCNSDVVIFCVDISKEDWTEDVSVQRLVKQRGRAKPCIGSNPTSSGVPVATKCDLICEKELTAHLRKLRELFDAEFLPISVKTNADLKSLRDTIDKKIVEKFKIPHIGGQGKATHWIKPDFVGLTARHRQAVTDSQTNIAEAINECKAGNDEVTAMMLRAAYQAISGIEQSTTGAVDEQILEQIFSRFCIGK